MTQKAVVSALLNDNMAELLVTRQTACGENCASCDGCGMSSTIKVCAVNRVHAAVGQIVEIETESRKIFSAIILVYFIPIVFLIAGYIVPYLAGAEDGVCILLSFALTALSSLAVVFFSKRKKNYSDFTYSIIRILEEV